MKVLSFQESESEEITLLLGNFDGLHLGHKNLIDRAKAIKRKLAILTFKNLYKIGFVRTLDERLLEYERFGFDYTIVLDFDELKDYKSAQLLNLILEKFNIKHVVCGEDFAFGKHLLHAEEDVERLAFEKGIGCSILPTFTIKNNRISSSLIKLLLKNGSINEVNKLLLENYSIYGKVVHGNNLGKTLHFPTMNFEINPLKIEPKDGVYLVYTYIDNNKYYGIANLGQRPTIETNSRNFEVHLLDFCESMYDKYVEVFFLERLRDTIKFDSIEELKLQLLLDESNARELICEKYEIL